MIVQLLLTVALGVGVLTLAMIGLFNTAGMRIHDYVKVSDGDWPSFSNVYWGDEAQRLRLTFARIPRIALWAAGTMATVVLVVGVAAHMCAVDQTKPEETYPYVLSVLSATFMFVATAVVCAYRVSARLYTVMNACLPRPTSTPPEPSPQSIAGTMPSP